LNCPDKLKLHGIGLNTALFSFAVAPIKTPCLKLAGSLPMVGSNMTLMTSMPKVTIRTGVVKAHKRPLIIYDASTTYGDCGSVVLNVLGQITAFHVGCETPSGFTNCGIAVADF
jgi:hypothetical protein